jgi:urease accessory protein
MEEKSMLCEKIIGSLQDEKYKNLEVDYVDIEWHEAFTKLHRKTSTLGEDVGIRLDNDVLLKGLNQDDVLYADDKKVIAVNIPECEAIEVVVAKDHERQIAKVCYEIGNRHATLFRGDDDFTFLTPYNEPMLLMLSKIHGVSAKKVMSKFNFNQSISSSINNHHH